MELLEQIQEETLTLTKTKVEAKYAIVLYNDDVNTFEHVINMLVKYCKHDAVQAEQCAFIVHYNGKCSVKNGSVKELKPICEALLEKYLTAQIELI
ncbi:MAG: ATP-dependent Clp protease adaptor ClpS [Bacteroidia bacterium]